MSFDIASEQPFLGFICTKCNYRCSRRNDLHKHFETQKHARMARRGLVMEQIIVVPVSNPNSSSMHECICGKEYRHLSSLCKHRRKCDYFHSHMGLMSSKSTTDPAPEPIPIPQAKEDVVLEENNAMDPSDTTEALDPSDTAEAMDPSDTAEALDPSDTAEALEPSDTTEALDPSDTAEAMDPSDTAEALEAEKEKEPSIFKSDTNALLIALLNEQAKRNDELKEMIERQGKQLEIVAAKVDLPTVTNVTTINNTNKFNLSFFLNSECKDAMNVTDFVETIKVTPADLERLAVMGYVEGVARMMIDGLRKLDVSQRPIHCTDVKRESFYIKDNDVWEKDNASGDKMHAVVKHVANRNVIAIPDWQKENPLHTDFSTRAHEQYLRIVNVAFGGANADDNENFRNKIIRKAAPELAPPKKTLHIKM